MKSIEAMKWHSAVTECRSHQERLLKAKQYIDKNLPFEPDDLAELSDEDCAWLDQYLYRFSKLQDTMGERLFPAGLLILGEDFTHRPFIDILNRLEALEMIPGRQWWQLQREYRNQIAHEYPERRIEQCAAINGICGECDEVLRVLDFVIDAIEFKRNENMTSSNEKENGL